MITNFIDLRMKDYGKPIFHYREAERVLSYFTVVSGFSYKDYYWPCNMFHPVLF